MNSRKETFVSQLFFFQDHAEFLAFERAGIENLVSAARTCRKRNQQIRFAKGKKLADRIGSCAGDYNICQSEEISQFILNIFELSITLQAFQGFIQFALATKVDDLELFQQLRKDFADSLIDCGGAETSSDDEDDRLFFLETTEFAGLRFWIKDVERGVWTFSFPIRHDAGL